MPFRIMGLVARLAPFGVLGAVAYAVGQFGVGSLAWRVAQFCVTVALVVFIALGLIPCAAYVGIFQFPAYLGTESNIVLATVSSDAVLAPIMREHEAIGVKDVVVRLAIPTGCSFYRAAFSIYLTLAVVSTAEATNTPLSLVDLLFVLGVSLVTSKVAHWVPGSAIVIFSPRRVTPCPAPL